MALICIEDLTFYYPEQRKPAIENIHLQLDSGDFTVLCGPSGCGKSTLLRALKPALAPHGKISGQIFFKDTPIDALDHRTQSAAIGFVGQSPENQIVTDKVWHELAFGLESLGEDTPTIRRRVAEMAAFFGIEDWFYKNVAELSGGQKQLLNLASVMVMQPTLLILDEPTAQLDPIAASEFLNILGKINRELGTTVFLTEHRLEEVFSLATNVAVLNEGHLMLSGSPTDVGSALKASGSKMFGAMPAAMRIWATVETNAPCPVSVRDGRAFFMNYQKEHPLRALPQEAQTPIGAPVLTADNVWFRYEKDGADVIKGMSLTLHKGEFLALLGGNGAGKSTALKLLCGIKNPYRGEISVKERLSLLPQNPQTLFLKKTVLEDLNEMLRDKSRAKAQNEAERTQVVQLCRLEKLLDRHPYDLSGGEQQRLALAKVLLTKPEILLLDEPTKGLDAEFKEVFAGILCRLAAAGVSLIMVSHDVEFCAKYAQNCGLFFDGSIVTKLPTREFFSGNSFYTTAANRIARPLEPKAVTPEDVMYLCGAAVSDDLKSVKSAHPLPTVDSESDQNAAKNQKAANLPQNSAGSQPYATNSVRNTVLADDESLGKDSTLPLPDNNSNFSKKASEKLPLWRKISAAVCGICALILLLYSAANTDLSSIVTDAGLTSMGQEQLLLYFAFCGFLLLSALFVGLGRRQKPSKTVGTGTLAGAPKEKRKLSKRTAMAAFCILLLIPLTLFAGVFYLDKQRYGLVSTLVLLECMAPFFLIFEGRKPKARELVVIAVLCAISVAGRAVFFMLPQFKPVLAMTVISGVALGAESGFLVGAVSMLASNMLFSQGPWTPWQMFCMGIIGFLAGLLYQKGLLRRTRTSLSVFGAFAAIVIYGGIMNPASMLIWAGSDTFTLKALLTYYVTGFPMDCVHAAATVFFLMAVAEPLLQKLDRVKTKYGLLE